MGWGTGNLGGGSGGLNFKVVGYATEAELLADTPKENTIGIITTNKITGWMFDAADPAEPVEGMVYITTGKESNIAFNALKKNGIMVYPLSAKQYVSGALVDVTAMSYQGGEWVDWLPENYLYYEGYEYEDITGGWTVEVDTSQGGLTKYDDYMQVQGLSGAFWGVCYTANPISVKKTLKFDMSVENFKETGWVGVKSDVSGDVKHNFVAKVSINSNMDRSIVSVETDSIMDLVYPTLVAGGSTIYKIFNVWME